MKYWVFQNNQVNGPYEAADLPALSGFSGDSLVCPEGRRGTSMGDWQRASVVADLSVTLMKTGQLAAAVAAPAAGGSTGGGLAPEPTLRDLASLGGLQEKVSALERTVAHLREDLDRKEGELLSLHAVIDDKDQRAQELSSKLGGLEERLADLSGVKDKLDRAVAAESEMEAAFKRQSETMEELSKRLEALKAEKKEPTLRFAAPPMAAPQAEAAPPPKIEPPILEIEPPLPRVEPPLPKVEPPAPKLEPATAPFLVVPPAPAPEPAAPPSALPPPPLVGTRPEAGKAEEAPFVLAPPPLAEISAPAAQAKLAGTREEAPRPEEKTFVLPPPPMPETPAPAPAPKVIGSKEELTREMQSMKAEKKLRELEEATLRTPPPMPGAVQPLSAPPILETPLPSSFQPLGEAVPPGAALPEAVAPAGPPAPAAKRKMPLAALAAVGALALTGLLFKSGLLGRRAKRKAPAAVPQAAAPAPSLAPKAPSPAEQAERFKQLAIDIVKSMPGPDGVKTVGQMLEGSFPPGGKLSPWMAEQIKDDLYQVNFYAPKTSENSPAVAYEFQAQLGARQAAAVNDAAKALLAPPPALSVPKRSISKGGGVSSRRPARKKRGAKAAKAKAAPAKKAPKTEAESLDELLLPGVPRKAEAPAPNAEPSEEPPAPASKDKSDAKAPADAKLLDDLLKP